MPVDSHVVGLEVPAEAIRAMPDRPNSILAWDAPRLTVPEVAPALCVSIHDVAPHTWPLCMRLLQAIHAVAPIPTTLLVVPAYHHYQVANPGLYDRHLEQRLACGDELALHGYTHLDEAPRASAWRERFRREVVTLREGEFAAIDADEARRRLTLGLNWFEQRGWPVGGFVAPAWLLGAGGVQAIVDFPFQYTTSFGEFHLLRHGVSVAAPSLVYSARNAAGRWLSPRWATVCAARQSEAPLVRLALHPSDANFPALLKHCQQLIERLLVRRSPMTKVMFARHWHESIIHQRHLESIRRHDARC